MFTLLLSRRMASAARALGASLLLGACLAPIAATAQPDVLSPQPIYSPLLPPQGDYRGAYAINDRGQVVGYGETAHGQQAILWQDGHAIELPTLGGMSAAIDINNRGQIVGWSRISDGTAHAVLWENGDIKDLGVLKPGESTFAIKINEAGQVLGGSTAPQMGLPPYVTLANTCFFWDRGTMTPVHGLGNMWCSPTDLNDAGQIIGDSDETGIMNRQHSFIWEDGVATRLDTLGGASTYATDINNRGQVVGASSTATGASYAFLWQQGVITDLGTLNNMQTIATAINDQGDIVGWGRLPDSVTHALLWRQGELIDIGASLTPDFASSATGINAAGQVVVQTGSPPIADYMDHKVGVFFWDQGLWQSVDSFGVVTAINARGQMTVDRGWLWQPGLAGLTLFNRLDSEAGIERSVHGPGGAFNDNRDGGSFVPGRGGAVYHATVDQTGRVSFPKKVVAGTRGAIHFWARLLDFPPVIELGQDLMLVGIRDDAGTAYGLTFTAGNPQGGGLCATAGHTFAACTGATRAATLNHWTYRDAILGANPAQWHHYALVWDLDGIVGLGDGTLKVAALVDGALVSPYTQHAPPLTMDPPVVGRLALLDTNMSVPHGSVEFSDLSVWSYARLEEAIMPPQQLFFPRIAK